MGDDFLESKTRAEDILLGALGFGEEAKLVSVERTSHGYSGVAAWQDGDQFPFESEDELEELEQWALRVLIDGVLGDQADAAKKNAAEKDAAQVDKPEKKRRSKAASKAA